MAGVTLTVRADQRQLQDLLRRLIDKYGNLLPVMRPLGELIRTSVVRNFEEAGRPRWARLSPVTIARRGGSNRPLRVQGFAGGLMGSINAQPAAKSVVVGTNKIYAAVHQFGAPKGSFGTVVANVPSHTRRTRSGSTTVRAHTRRASLPWGNIPARPYMEIQDSDWPNIIRLLENHLVEA